MEALAREQQEKSKEDKYSPLIIKSQGRRSDSSFSVGRLKNEAKVDNSTLYYQTQTRPAHLDEVPIRLSATQPLTDRTKKLTEFLK